VKSLIDDVKKFHLLTATPILPRPKKPSLARINLRETLLREEYMEAIEAMEQLKSALPGDEKTQLCNLARELVDVIYVAVGAAIETGIDLQPIWDEVQRANMTKTLDHQRSDGKVIKPPGFVPPQINPIITEQIIQGHE